MKVEKLMNRNVLACRTSDSLNTAAQLMWENDCGCVPVLSADGDGSVVGMLTDRDICMAAYTQGRSLSAIPVETAMARQVISCRPNDDVSVIEARMRSNHIRRIPVIDERGSLQGIVSLNDLAREAGRESAMSTLPEITLAEIAQTLAVVCEHRGESSESARTA